jgi:hypothetical protein
MTIWTWILAALGHSIGWGIRGNFGHETGAMLAGVLGTMGAVLLSDRQNWHRRAALFGVLGAIGWSFGGSISYMQVVAYTHSGHWPSQLYGFAALFVIGFCWGAPGGTGVGIAASWSAQKVADLLKLITVVFSAWFIQGWVIMPRLAASLSRERYRELTHWYDTDWIAAAVAPVVLVIWSIPKSHRNAATRLGWSMTLGWWAGFLLLVNVLGMRMTPPRGDNWAGCVGMIAGIFVWSVREGEMLPRLTTLSCGLVGGLSFSAAPMIKLSLAVATGRDTNWHSVMEQLTGLMNGIGVAWTVAIAYRSIESKRPEGREPITAFWQGWCVAFIWILVTFLNLWKNAEEWSKQGAMAERLYGIRVLDWVYVAYAGLTVVLVLALVRNARKPLALVPISALGKGQWIFLIFLWWIVIGNFDRAQIKFGEQRLITEGVIFVNALVCTALLLLGEPRLIHEDEIRATEGLDADDRWRRLLRCSVAATLVGILINFFVVRGIFGDEFAGHASLHIRFGPRSTVETGPK